MWIEIEMYVLLFFACSFLGWCMEVTCKLVQFGRFINRGFLLGPLCPIYGTGAVLMAYFLPLWTTQVESTFLLQQVVTPFPGRHVTISARRNLMNPDERVLWTAHPARGTVMDAETLAYAQAELARLRAEYAF